jgi:aminoglycoside phosphotransferase (APT) family kinase protein
VDKADITAALVSRLVAAQFPKWAHLRVSPVECDGWDNTTFRLGSIYSVRMPSHNRYVPQIDKEHRWLPVLAPKLPLPIPQPLGKGEPTPEFPRPWSIYSWITGSSATPERIDDLTAFASDIAVFLAALYSCDSSRGPEPGPHSFNRGGPLVAWDIQVREALRALDGLIDTTRAAAVWESALAAVNHNPAVWVHGDVTGSNLIVAGGRLSAVIDFGCCAVGDPACDTTIAWTFFSDDSRAAFVSRLALDEAAWMRGRGWALWKALITLSADLASPGSAAQSLRRWGWRWDAEQVINEVIADAEAAR